MFLSCLHKVPLLGLGCLELLLRIIVGPVHWLLIHDKVLAGCSAVCSAWLGALSIVRADVAGEERSPRHEG